MPLSSSGYHSCFVFGRDVPGSSISPKAALVAEAFHGFIYSREMPGQVLQRPRPPPSTSQIVHDHQSFLLFDALHAALLAVSLHDSQINKYIYRKVRNIIHFHLFFFFLIHERVEKFLRFHFCPCIIFFAPVLR